MTPCPQCGKGELVPVNDGQELRCTKCPAAYYRSFRYPNWQPFVDPNGTGTVRWGYCFNCGQYHDLSKHCGGYVEPNQDIIVTCESKCKEVSI